MMNEYDAFIEKLSDANYRMHIAGICKADFKRYLLTVFYIINGSKFYLKPFHKRVIKALQDLVDCENKKRNLALCLPVGSGKSLIVEYFITWCFARSVDNTFCYNSHSDRLINRLSKECKDIIENPYWILLFENQLKKDDRQRVNFSFEGAKNRTGLTAGTTGGAITGLDCFDFNEPVATNNGWLKIGEIVDKKLDVQILSNNIETGENEYKSILRYIKKEHSNLIEVILNNGLKVKCTPTHYFYTQRGYVQAQDLRFDDILVSYPFDDIKGTVKFFHKIFSGIIFIAYFFYFILAKDFFVPRNNSTFNPYSLCDIPPIFPTFNRCYVSISNIIFRSNNFSGSGVFSNINGLLFSKFKNIIGIFSVARTRMMYDRIKHIFGSCTIGEIFNIIVKFIPVKMSNIHFRRSYSNKCQCDQNMDKSFNRFSVFPQTNNFISSCTDPRFENNSSFNLFSALLKNITCFTSDFSVFSNAIKSFISRDWKPFFIRRVSHDITSYCVTVCGNYNMYIGGSQGVLVSNCGNPNIDGFSGALIIDDPMDAGNARYEKSREEVVTFYDEKLSTRRRTPNTPTILIMQRLHLDDLVGWIEKNEPEQWEIVKIPALDENGQSFWEERYPVEELKHIQRINNFKFQSQYQQDPIASGGAVIKTEWFKYYSQSVEYQYKRIFITGDTAQKIKEHNDYSVFMVWGVTKFGKLHLLDEIRGKWEAPDLKRQVKILWNRWSKGIGNTPCSGLYVEDKASGTGLIQEIKRECAIPVLPLQADKDKLTRLEAVLAHIEAGNVELPNSPEQNKELLNECEAFTRDDSHSHDDQVDTLVYGIMVGLSKLQVSILEVL